MLTPVQRILVLTGVAAAHVAFLFIKVSTLPENNDSSAQSTLIFVSVPKQMIRSEAKRSNAVEKQTTPVNPQHKSEYLEPTPAVSLSIDEWHDEARTAIDVTLARQAREKEYHSFDRQSKAEEPLYEDIGKGIFDRGPAHKVGVVMYVGDGVFKTWISPYCYVSSGMTPRGREDITICAQPGTNANLSDMFSQYKPEYLTGPLPVPKQPETSNDDLQDADRGLTR